MQLEQHEFFLWNLNLKLGLFVISFHKMVLTWFGINIKCIRPENALKFNLTDFYNSNGIIHQQSCVYTPQQNSVVERKYQHILYVDRALQSQSNLPLKL